MSVAPEMVCSGSAANQYTVQLRLVPLFDNLLNSTRAVFDDLMIASFLVIYAATAGIRHGRMELGNTITAGGKYRYEEPEHLISKLDQTRRSGSY